MPTVGTVRSVIRDWAAWVRQQEPEAAREDKWTVEYVFGEGTKNRRVFRANPDQRGAYEDD